MEVLLLPKTLLPAPLLTDAGLTGIENEKENAKEALTTLPIAVATFPELETEIAELEDLDFTDRLQDLPWIETAALALESATQEEREVQLILVVPSIRIAISVLDQFKNCLKAPQ